MKILIYGSKGWIGKQVLNYLNNEKIYYVEGNERVNNVEEIKKEIETINPTHILSLIGRTHGKIGDKIISTIDYLEEEGKLVENVRDNLYSPLILAIICNQKNIHFTYLGTGCIFDYDDEHYNGFKEEDMPNFFGSSYSIVKGFTDSIMKHMNVLNLRIRMPINSDNNSRNFITKITTYDKICSISNSMSVLPELIPYSIKMMEKNIIGTINLTNPGVISHNEILQLYKEIVDPLFTWKNFSIEEQNEVLSSKRSNNMLNTLWLEPKDYRFTFFHEQSRLDELIYDKFTVQGGENILNKNIDDIETLVKLDNIIILPYSYHRYWEDGEIKYVYHAGGNTGTKLERIKRIINKDE